MNEIRITVHGNVVNEPSTKTGRTGSVFTTFRVGATPYKKTADGKFVDSETSFFNVIAFDALAANSETSLRKGQAVIVEGNLSTRSYLGSDGITRPSLDVVADHIGHDLKFGRASFLRVSKAAALGLDRAADEDVLNAVAGMNGAEAVPFDRPANVDANGEVHGDLSGEDPFYGDPDSDDYTAEEPAA